MIATVTDRLDCIVEIDRNASLDAVDAPTVQALADAFRRFDADPARSVAAFAGAHRTFCADADLKAMADEARR